MKVVINKCYGGFGLSEKGMKRYAELKGLKLYPEKDKRLLLTTYWLVPKKNRVKYDEKKWAESSLKERQEYNRLWGEQTIYDRTIERNDPYLVQVVEELGDKANGKFAELKVVEIPDNLDWKIEEYDGREWIAEVHQTWG